MRYLKPAKPKGLKLSELKWSCDPKMLKVKTSKNIEGTDKILGQERALDALKLGVGLWAHGYNIYIAGLSGTGKATTVKKILESISTQKPNLYDYAYVNNFKDGDRPTLLVFPAGQAAKFKQDLAQTIKYLQEKIPQALQSDSYIVQKKKLLAEFSRVEQDILVEFEEQLKKENFYLGQVKEGESIRSDLMPIIDGKPVPIAKIDELVQKNKITKDRAKIIYDNYNEHQQMLQVLFQKGYKITQDYQERVIELERSSVEIVVNATINNLLEIYSDEKVTEYLKLAEINILDNLDVFKSQQKQLNTDENGEEYEVDYFRDYEVNVVLDNSGKDRRPVVIESFPSYSNLFGTIEKYYDGHGGWYADFTKIKAGSLLRANGGYLVLNAMDALDEPGLWKTLKRVMLYGQLEIQDLYSLYQFSPTVLKPEPIEINVKVIFIGSQYLYWMLSNYEDDFKKIFKVKADFDFDFKVNSDDNVNEYIKVIKNLIDKEGLLQFKSDALAKILEYSARYVGKKDKLTLRFSYITDLLRESNFWALEGNAKIVTSEHVVNAYMNARKRHSLYEDILVDMYKDGTILVETDGAKIGQVNGLTVYENDIYSFGKPVKITSAVSLGNGSILNVEREAELSGSSFNKAVHIITGYLREKFGKSESLSFNASIVFEQAYSLIDGDSASVAELCALLSAISEIPLKQNIAVTGSLNQKGQVQPVGGVNEKIEGFFEVCLRKGLTGTQGVIIPKLNVPDLMLNDEVINAVRNKQFHIYSVSNVEEAVEILSDVKVDTELIGNQYVKGTFYYGVMTKIQEMQKINKKNKK